MPDLKTPSTPTPDILESVELLDIADSYAIFTTEEDWKKENPGRKVKIYFDSYDATRILRGILAFDKPLIFDFKSFKSEAALIYSMAYEDWLGPISLLPPHQDELAFNLKESSHLFPSKKGFNDSNLEEQLSADLGLDRFKERSDKPTRKEIEEYLYNLRDKGRDLFNASVLLKTPFWYHRFKYLTEEKKILQLNDDTYNFTRISSLPLYPILLRAFEVHRKNFHRSNIVDALSFCILQEELNEFNEGKSDVHLPIFYVSTPVTYKALEDVRQKCSNEKYFSYRYKGKDIPVLREADFFILDAILSSKIKENHPFHHLLVALSEEISRDSKAYKALHGNDSKVFLEKFRKNVIEKIDMEFFNKIWLESEGYNTVSKALKWDILQNEAYRKKVVALAQIQREELAKRLQTNFHQFEVLDLLLKDLFSIDKVVKKYEFHLDEDIDVFTDFGLTRFSFSKECCKDIRQRADNMLKSLQKGTMDDEEYILQVNDMLRLMVDGMFNNPNEALGVGLALLWVFDSFQLIVKLCDMIYEKHKGFSNYQIPLLYAASLLCSEDVNLRKCIKIVRYIEDKHLKEDDYRIWIGLAYIYWRQWFVENKHPIVPELMNERDRLSFRKDDSFKWIKKALEYSKKAVDRLGPLHGNKKEAEVEAEPTLNEIHLKGRGKTGTSAEEGNSKIVYRNRKYYYALNQYVFFITQSGTKDEFMDQKTDSLFNDFLRGKAPPTFWQPHFYDTFALYYLRRALLADTEEMFTEFLGLAKSNNERSSKESKRKENFDELLREKIILIGAEGFGKWK